MRSEEQGGLDWRPGGVPVSRRFGDPYFSLQGGLAETGHVFHAGNDLEKRLRDGFAIAETGFGTGLNLLATVTLWQRLGRRGSIQFTSFEAFPLAADEMAAAHQGFPEIAQLSGEFVDLWAAGARAFTLGGVAVEVIEGDARETLPAWQGKADAWFLDGFAPAKNPELWTSELMQAVARHTRPGGTFASYTAAGPVRRALEEAGFEVERTAGFGAKRHMTRGRLR